MDKTELGRVLTKVLHRLPTDSEAALSRLGALLDRAEVHITELRVVVGGQDEIDRLKADNLGMRAALHPTWENFAAIAAAKGYSKPKLMAKAVGKTLAHILECKRLGHVPLAFVKAIGEAPVLVPEGDLPDKTAAEVRRKQRAREHTEHHYAEFERWVLEQTPNAKGRVTVVPFIRNRGIDDRAQVLLKRRFIETNPDKAALLQLRALPTSKPKRRRARPQRRPGGAAPRPEKEAA